MTKGFLKGSLEVIAGPMFAGKTSALLAKARTLEGEVVLIKPSFDTRYGICEIKSHDGVSANAFNLTNTSEILDSFEISKADYVLFDEIQFFTEPYFNGDIVECIETLRDRHINIVCCGLDLTWQAEPFKIVEALQKISDKNTPLFARCAVCGADAPYSHKLHANDEKFELGASDLYEPRCPKHFPYCAEYMGEPHTHETEPDLFSFAEKKR